MKTPPVMILARQVTARPAGSLMPETCTLAAPFIVLSRTPGDSDLHPTRRNERHGSTLSCCLGSSTRIRADRFVV